MAKDNIKMFANLLYVLPGQGCITVDKKTYNSETDPVPKDMISEQDAKSLIKSGVAAEGPSKKTVVNMDSAAKKKVKEQSGVIAEQHEKLEKLALDLKGLPGLKEKVATIPELNKEITGLKKAVKTAEEAGKEELEILTEEIDKLKKENEELREMAK